MNLSLENVSHTANDKAYIRDVNLTIEHGDCCVIKGKSGCGKSLLFSILSDIIRPDNGHVLIDGVHINSMSKKQYDDYKKNMGVIFQLPALISNLTVKENLLLPLNRYLTDVCLEKKENIVSQKCEEIGLKDYLNKRTEHLSIGMASLVGVARATLLKPKLVIWDSPINEVDNDWVDYELQLIQSMKNDAVTQILFSNRHVIDSLCSSRFYLEQGKCYAA